MMSTSLWMDHLYHPLEQNELETNSFFFVSCHLSYMYATCLTAIKTLSWAIRVFGIIIIAIAHPLLEQFVCRSHFQDIITNSPVPVFRFEWSLLGNVRRAHKKTSFNGCQFTARRRRDDLSADVNQLNEIKCETACGTLCVCSWQSKSPHSASCWLASCVRRSFLMSRALVPSPQTGSQLCSTADFDF
jgi:hypothetical protein